MSQDTQAATNYYTRMDSSLSLLRKANTFESYLQASYQLSLLAEDEETKWIVYYHSSFAHIMSAFLATKENDIETHIVQAQNMLDKANILRPNNDELHALQGYIYQAKMINKNGKEIHTWAHKAIMEYDHARFINPNNPRPYYLIGQLLYELPPGFGGNKKSACKLFIQAKEKFQSFSPKSSFSPNWGEEENLKMLKHCK